MFGGIAIELDVLGITDVPTIIIVCTIVALAIILVWYLARKLSHQKKEVAVEPPADEIFELVSRIKYPARMTPEPGKSHDVTTPLSKPEPEQSPKPIDLLKNRENITASLQALAQKYSLAEITLATDDGLVLASSAGHDVQADAAKYSQTARRQSAPDEPDVSLFELRHKDENIIGIIRTGNDISQNWKKGIREDTKVILQWWV